MINFDFWNHSPPSKREIVLILSNCLGPQTTAWNPKEVTEKSDFKSFFSSLSCLGEKYLNNLASK